MTEMFAWIQATEIAGTVRDSVLLTGALSATHLLGFTLVTGGAFVANLRLIGVLLTDHPVIDVARPAGRGVAVGVGISLATGLLLFAPRASAASANSIFQLKMLLLGLATAFHFTIHRSATRRVGVAPRVLRGVGATGFLLWTGVAMAGCAFILFE
ncbi:MAG: DUF6644 family protein [Vicinamibacterales bacterium]